MPSYFTPELFRFLTRLKRNNNRDWFLAHKDEYETHARQPALQFITDFAGPLYEITPHLASDPRGTRGSLFRIYRDTRFSSDKRPYKTHLAMRFSHRGKDVHSPGFYLHLEPGGCFAASGLWHPEPATLLEGPQRHGGARQRVARRCESCSTGMMPASSPVRPAAFPLIMSLWRT